MARGSRSEVHAYSHILKELDKKGFESQDIFTQQECRTILPIALELGDDLPENIVRISETQYYLIESKNERTKINNSISEAREYADKINKSNIVKCIFITGIAGNDKEGYFAKSQFYKNGKWKSITENEVELTKILSKTQISIIIDTNDPDLKEVEISDQEFLKAAEDINEYLHEGGTNKDLRAKYISAILLALADSSDLNLNVEPYELITTINTRVELLLKRHNKADFASFIKIDLPSSTDNHNRFKTSIVKTIQSLLDLNIRSAMRSGNDLLGKFYEVFLKYGNGAKEIGIVLTPRHITKFAAEVLDIQPNDLVFDPTCGTGGFLVAAFDEVRMKTNPKEFEKFKKYGLYGIEQQDPVVALALVNMIFRGDGKNNIIEGDCFAKWLNAKTVDRELIAEFVSKDTDTRTPPITKVLMNPPFPNKKTDRKEYMFIEHALKQIQDGGLLFSVLPYSCMVKGGGYLNWRERMLKENTLLSVVTFPEDLFYPVGVHTVGIFLKKGYPHQKNENVFWIRALNDGLLKRKGKRLPNERATNDLAEIRQSLKLFISEKEADIENIPKFIKASPIDFKDDMLELVPENYLDDTIPSTDEIEESVDQIVRDAVAFLISNKMEGFLNGKV